MKKIKQILYGVIAVAFVAMPLMAVAAGFTVPADGTAGLRNTTVFDLISTTLNWLLGIIGVLGVVVFVISGILYLTAAGNEENTERAKKVMLYAIIGLVVALVGLIIVNAIFGITGGGGGTTY